MATERHYHVYIMASKSRVLYVGVTGGLARRVQQHKEKRTDGFTKRYNVTRLVYCECFGDVWDALAREKQVKAWRRSKKVALIEADNPEWRDLTEVM